MEVLRSLLLLAAILFILSGCASTDNLVVQYSPVASVKGGSGVVYLAVDDPGSRVRRKSTNRRPAACRDSAGKWLVITEKTATGKELGERFTSLATDTLLLDAFTQELSAAGYTVKRVVRVPQNADQAVILVRSNVNAEESSGKVERTAGSDVHVDIDVWRKGAKVRQLSYEAHATRDGLRSRNALLATALREGLQTLMTQAVPEIVKELGGR